MITILAPVRNASEASALLWTLRRQPERRWFLWCTAAAPVSLRAFAQHAAPRFAPEQVRVATYPRGATAHQQLTPLVAALATPVVLVLPLGGLLGAGVVAAAVQAAAAPLSSVMHLSPTDTDHGTPPRQYDMTPTEFSRSVLWMATATLRRAWTDDPAETQRRLRESTTLAPAEHVSGAVTCDT